VPQSRTAYRPTPTNPPPAAPQPSGSTTVQDSDDLLDEIDACLEENALEVVRAFHQRGGQ
jgi:ubiquitin-like protein Pup